MSSTQANFTIQQVVSHEMTVSATFSSFLDDETQAEQAGAQAAGLFSAWIKGYITRNTQDDT